jgi:adenine deaminase
MSTEDAEFVAEQYEKVHSMAKEMGSELTAPFMTMAFMALLVIPELKIGDKGLFDVNKFEFTSLFVES